MLLSAFNAPCYASPLDTLFMRGDSSIAIEWTADSVNTRNDWYSTNGSLCTGADSVYKHCDFIPGVTYHSIAYSYGGEDGYIKFRDKITAGLLIGSHMCHYNKYGDPSAIVAGTDCSGFVCYLWNVPRVATGTLNSQYKIITRAELDVGDILVKPGSHAVLIIEKEDDNIFLIWESTSAVNGCRERSIDLTDTYWNAYNPRRYEALTMDVTYAATNNQNYLFPAVIFSGQRICITAAAPWHGTAELFTLSGKQLLSTTCMLEKEQSIALANIQASGVTILRLRKNDGENVTVPLHSLIR
jgi:hypothetical protein